MDSIKETMDMKRWAVVGATDKKDRFGYKIVKKLKDSGYQVFPVSPKLNEIEGLKCYASISDIDEKIDVVDMVVNPRIGIKVMEEIKEKNIQYVWLQPGTRSEEIKDFAEKGDISIIEDCIYARLG
ncbi:CoA-binding protein [Natronospora cellulosivora (SeqCode)]